MRGCAEDCEIGRERKGVGKEVEKYSNKYELLECMVVLTWMNLRSELGPIKRSIIAEIVQEGGCIEHKCIYISGCHRDEGRENIW